MLTEASVGKVELEQWPRRFTVDMPFAIRIEELAKVPGSNKNVHPPSLCLLKLLELIAGLEKPLSAAAYTARSRLWRRSLAALKENFRQVLMSVVPHRPPQHIPCPSGSGPSGEGHRQGWPRLRDHQGGADQDPLVLHRHRRWTGRNSRRRPFFFSRRRQLWQKLLCYLSFSGTR